ncbi:MAG: tRNA (guanosine(46)-N7)-methyltransferase TrmB [Bacteroidia bacterium]|nr:tRNA (guanosine(46)-N7)-methyltransferase TrmB [Bacteroidia bacterium]
MGKNKLQRFAEMAAFDNVFQPRFDEIYEKSFRFRGKWNSEYFRKLNPIVLELGCGKGEYTVNLAKRFPEKNYIGVDIKGARIWKGAKYALENKIQNVAFIRTKIEFINSFFANDEISEIWLTFPDPQEKKKRAEKRLTSPRFLNYYRQLLHDNGVIHLKTDNTVLFQYTLALIRENNLEIIAATDNLYNTGFADNILSIKTFYEEQFLKQGKNIAYICFKL